MAAHLEGTIIIPLSEQDYALPAMRAHIRVTRREAGCLHFEITADESNPELFHVREEFTDRAAFQHHQKLGRKRKWGVIAREYRRDFKYWED